MGDVRAALQAGIRPAANAATTPRALARTTLRKGMTRVRNSKPKVAALREVTTYESATPSISPNTMPMSESATASSSARRSTSPRVSPMVRRSACSLVRSTTDAMKVL